MTVSVVGKKGGAQKKKKGTGGTCRYKFKTYLRGQYALIEVNTIRF